MHEYQQCKNQAARDKFVQKHSTRFSQFARLPYFDICRMVVVDPMHNLLLGMY